MAKKEKYWVSSFWVVDEVVAAAEPANLQSAIATLRGPLTIACRSRDTYEALASSNAVKSELITLRPAMTREQMMIELARFSASATSPYLHVVPGCFHYERHSSRFLGQSLARAGPACCAVECACRAGDSYFFRGVSVGARFARARGQGRSFDVTPIDTFLFRRDIFAEVRDLLMRVPPDPGWYDLVVRMYLARSGCVPAVIPLMFGATVASGTLDNAVGWQGHALSLVEEWLNGCEVRVEGKIDADVAAGTLLDVVNVLCCGRSLSPSARRYIEQRGVKIAFRCIDILADEFFADRARSVEFFGLLCDILKLEGPNTMEMRRDLCHRFFADRLVTFVQAGRDKTLTLVVGQILKAARMADETAAGRNYIRELLQTIAALEAERKLYRSVAASMLDRAQLEQQRKKLNKSNSR